MAGLTVATIYVKMENGYAAARQYTAVRMTLILLRAAYFVILEYIIPRLIRGGVPTVNVAYHVRIEKRFDAELLGSYVRAVMPFFLDREREREREDFRLDDGTWGAR